MQTSTGWKDRAGSAAADQPLAARRPTLFWVTRAIFHPVRRAAIATSQAATDAAKKRAVNGQVDLRRMPQVVAISWRTGWAKHASKSWPMIGPPRLPRAYKPPPAACAGHIMHHAPHLAQMISANCRSWPEKVQPLQPVERPFG
ncbi:hypothetical protein [Gemmobacter serpentinus]|uniref:hypothetical protein n=1 Tax=Gemmobacter serpentinus TaxID=2652247 RepID=UPI00186580F0|nr:hypothetical protein [Gemmobacter serpentinus]